MHQQVNHAKCQRYLPTQNVPKDRTDFPAPEQSITNKTEVIIRYRIKIEKYPIYRPPSRPPENL